MSKKSPLPWVETTRSRPPFHYKNVASFYASTPWRNLREFKLMESPLCEDHLSQGETVPAEEVDHIIEISVNPDLSLEISNLRSLCKTCHSKKSNRHLNASRNKNRGGIITFKTKYLNNDKPKREPGSPDSRQMR